MENEVLGYMSGAVAFAIMLVGYIGAVFLLRAQQREAYAKSQQGQFEARVREMVGDIPISMTDAAADADGSVYLYGYRPDRNEFAGEWQTDRESWFVGFDAAAAMFWKDSHIKLKARNAK